MNKEAVKVYELFDTLYMNENDKELNRVQDEWRHKESVKTVYVSMFQDDAEALRDEGKIGLDRGMTVFDSMDKALNDVKEYNEG